MGTRSWKAYVGHNCLSSKVCTSHNQTFSSGTWGPFLCLPRFTPHPRTTNPISIQTLSEGSRGTQSRARKELGIKSRDLFARELSVSLCVLAGKWG